MAESLANGLSINLLINQWFFYENNLQASNPIKPVTSAPRRNLQRVGALTSHPVIEMLDGIRALLAHGRIVAEHTAIKATRTTNFPNILNEILN